jgi:hypothetical protein
VNLQMHDHPAGSRLERRNLRASIVTAVPA